MLVCSGRTGYVSLCALLLLLLLETRNILYRSYFFFQMGKGPDEVWQLVNLVPRNGKEEVFCKHCKWTITVKNASRVKNHLANDCKNCPEVIKTIVRGMMKGLKAWSQKSSSLVDLNHEEHDVENAGLSPSTSPALSLRTPSSNSDVSRGFSRL